jgi:hypothetical protein
VRVSDASRALFVHVPKTGGSTIDAFFDKEIADARRVGKLGRHSPYHRIIREERELAGYWSFGFVRNPWARMVSWWTMIAESFAAIDAGKEHAIRKIELFPNAWLPEGEFRDDFDGFVLRGTEKIAKVGRPQARTLSRRPKGRGRLVDFVGRVETFDRDAALVREKLGLPPVEEVPRRNRTTHGQYTDYYTDATRQRIAEVFAEDIEAFGYRFGDT